MRGGPGPWALATHWGNTLHREVNGDGENQTEFFFFFFTFFHPSFPFQRTGRISWAAVGRIIRAGLFFLPASQPCGRFRQQVTLVRVTFPFHSCSGEKAKTLCPAAARKDYEHSGMYVAKTDLALKRPFCPISIPLSVLQRLFFLLPHIKPNASLTSVVINSCPCACFGDIKTRWTSTRKVYLKSKPIYFSCCFIMTMKAGGPCSKYGQTWKTISLYTERAFHFAAVFSMLSTN